MADLSLDDFIKKKNFKVRIGGLNNPSQRQGSKKRQFQNQGLKQKVKGQGQNAGAGRKFDARQKLPAKKPMGDARSKITGLKKGGAGDARSKIVQKQVQKGTFDVRSLLQRKAQKSGNAQQNPGGKRQAGPKVAPIAKTPQPGKLKERGQIVLTPTGLSVTRPAQGPQVSLSGNSLQVTRPNQPKPQSAPAPSRKDAIPIIQIRNDRYKQPAPLTRTAAPVSHYAESAYDPYDPYSEPGYPRVSGYRDLDEPPDIPRVRINNPRATGAGVRYSDSGRAPPGAATLSARQPKALPVQKMPAVGQKRRSAPEEVSGPLRLGKGGGPGIDLDIHNVSAVKKSKMLPAANVEVIDVDLPDIDYISPLQGFRVVVSNLFSTVTQDDIIELFGAVGPLKKARLMKSGTAEVVYISKADALSAVQKYHSRELDGQPMYVKMTTPIGAQVRTLKTNDPDITGEALRLYKKATPQEISAKPPVGVPTIHRALFKAGPPGPNKSVRFTVKI